MGTFNVAKYKKLNGNIKKYVQDLIDIQVALPVIIGETQSEMLEQYTVPRNELKDFSNYVKKKVFDTYIEQSLCVSEIHINWDVLPGVKRKIWTSLVEHYYNMVAFEKAVLLTGETIVKTYNIAPIFLLWLGIYISEAAETVFFDDTDCGMEEMFYGGFDGNASTYKGKDLATNKFALSPCEQGVVNDKDEIVSPFDPETVELFMDMYDDMTWDVMPDDHRKMILETYDIPDYMIRTFSETWRGMPIFTHDILITTVYDANDECKGDIILTHILMGDEILTLVLQNDNNVIIQEDDVQFSMNIGSLHDHPEMMEMYEAALSAAIMNDNK